MKKLNFGVILTLLGIICLTTAGALLFRDSNPKTQQSLETQSVSVKEELITQEVTSTPTDSPTSSPTVEPTATPYHFPSIDDLSRSREDYIYIINFMLSSGEEKFNDSFLNSAGGVTYLRSDGSAIAFMENDNGKITKFSYYTDLSETASADTELTFEEAEIISIMLNCAYGSSAFDNEEIYNYLDEILNHDFDEIKLGITLEYGDCTCVFDNMVLRGQNFAITYKE